MSRQEAHDLRNLLSTILMACEALNGRDPLGLAAVIERAAQAMLTMIHADEVQRETANEMQREA